MIMCKNNEKQMWLQLTSRDIIHYLTNSILWNYTDQVRYNNNVTATIPKDWFFPLLQLTNIDYFGFSTLQKHSSKGYLILYVSATSNFN